MIAPAVPARPDGPRRYFRGFWWDFDLWQWRPIYEHYPSLWERGLKPRELN